MGLRKDSGQPQTCTDSSVSPRPQEKRRLVNRYRWKTTVGDIAERQTIVNRWNDEFDHRPAPDYFQSFGLGFYEYFQLAEDIGASPLPILNCGMACQFNSGELAQLSDTKEYIQDALDLIEFANGPVTSPWGKLRASMGHPSPFHLTMIGVGNEQWGQPYVERYKLFAAASKQNILRSTRRRCRPGALRRPIRVSVVQLAHAESRHRRRTLLHESPVVPHQHRTLTTTIGRDPCSRRRICRPDLRRGKARQSQQLECRIAEAAYMTGLERNADVAAWHPTLLCSLTWTPGNGRPMPSGSTTCAPTALRTTMSRAYLPTMWERELCPSPLRRKADSTPALRSTTAPMN